MVIGASATVLWDIFLAQRMTEFLRGWKSEKKNKDLEKAGVAVKDGNDEDELRGDVMPKSVNGSDKGSNEAVAKSRRSGEENRNENESDTNIVMHNAGQGELQRRTSDGRGVAAVPLTDGTTVRNVANEEHQIGGRDRRQKHTKAPGEGAKRESVSQGSTAEFSTDMQSHAISMRFGIIVTIAFVGK